MSSHIKFQDNDDSDYNATDSDDDYDENEKILLDNVRKGRQQDSNSEEEVFGVGESDDDGDDDDHSDIALSDIEGEDDDDLPDTKAWGKDKRKFYASDDLGTSKNISKMSMEARLEIMQLEVEEADRLHKAQMAEFDDEDFMPLHKTPNERNEVASTGEDEGEKDEAKKTAEPSKTDLTKSKLSKMTREEIIAEMNKTCPLFFPIIDDHERKMEHVGLYLEPIIKQYDDGKIPDGPAMKFIFRYYDQLITYTLLVVMLKKLMSQHVDVKKHPIIKDLFEIRQEIELAESVFLGLLPQIKQMLEPEKVGNTKKAKTEKKEKKKTNKRKSVSETEGKSAKAVKFDDEVKEPEGGGRAEDDEEEEEEEEGKKDKEGRDVRTITYEMKKNKGLTPHRKKEQRNPRVKHKNKFRKAKINRKGAVREVRTETSRYGGEASGINPYVVKSRKFTY